MFCNKPTNVRGQRAHGTTSRPVAVNLFDQEMVGWVFDGDTLVLVRNLNVMDPYVGSPHVDAIETTLVTAMDDHVVDLAIGARVNTQVELGGY